MPADRKKEGAAVTLELNVTMTVRVREAVLERKYGTDWRQHLDQIALGDLGLLSFMGSDTGTEMVSYCTDEFVTIHKEGT
jgi:hypothetical protein